MQKKSHTVQLRRTALNINYDCIILKLTEIKIPVFFNNCKYLGVKIDELLSLDYKCHLIITIARAFIRVSVPSGLFLNLSFFCSSTDYPSIHSSVYFGDYYRQFKHHACRFIKIPENVVSKSHIQIAIRSQIYQLSEWDVNFPAFCQVAQQLTSIPIYAPGWRETMQEFRRYIKQCYGR